MAVPPPRCGAALIPSGRLSYLPLLLLARTVWPALARPVGDAEESSAPVSRPTTAVVSVHQPADLFGVYAASFATFSGWPLPKGDLALRVPPAADDVGCEEAVSSSPATKEGLGPSSGFVMVVMRGNCTFVQKALVAQTAGASGVVVVSQDESVVAMGTGINESDSATAVGVFVVGVPNGVGLRFINSSRAAARGDAVQPTLSIAPYQNSLLNVSEAVLILLATALVALGALFSTADVKVPGSLGKARAPHTGGATEDESFATALAAPPEEVLEMDGWLAVGFCVTGSFFLVFLFFLMQYLIYVIIGCFCIGGLSCLTQFGGIVINHFVLPLRNKGVMIPVLGPVLFADILAFFPALAIVISWLVLRNTAYGWLFQDIIGSGFLCWLQRTLRLPNIQVASLLLTMMFFFDIFWVFISPLFFHESVMVRVATGGGTGESVPMLLRIPTIGDPFGGDRLLGFGDIALPGLLVSYLRRHDLLSGRRCCNGYFVPALVGYFVGLNCTIAALVIMRMGQPALLYLVPGTLGTTLLLSFCRGEVGLLWRGITAGDPRSAGDPGCCGDQEALSPGTSDSGDDEEGRAAGAE